MSLKHYIKFYYPGILFSETEIKEIPNRERLPEIPTACYGFSFFDKEEINVDGEELKGKPKNQSGMYYFGEKFSLAEVKGKFPQHKTLISNMEGNKYRNIVKTRRGNFLPLRKGDVLI